MRMEESEVETSCRTPEAPHARALLRHTKRGAEWNKDGIEFFQILGYVPPDRMGVIVRIWGVAFCTLENMQRPPKKFTMLFLSM